MAIKLHNKNNIYLFLSMKEIFTYLFADRLKSYFYRTFIVTWLLVNWEIVLTIFGFGWLEESVQAKGLICAVHYYGGNSWNLIFFPLISSFLLIWLLPKIDLEIAKYKEKDMQTKYLKEVKHNKDSIFTGATIKLKDKEISEMELKYAKAEAKATEYETRYSEKNTEFIKYKKENKYAKNWEINTFDFFKHYKYDYEILNKYENSILEKGVLQFGDDNIYINMRPNAKSNYYYKILLFKYIEIKLWFSLWLQDDRTDLELLNTDLSQPHAFTLVLDDEKLTGTFSCYNMNKQNTDDYTIKLTKKVS